MNLRDMAGEAEGLFREIAAHREALRRHHTGVAGTLVRHDRYPLRFVAGFAGVTMVTASRPSRVPLSFERIRPLRLDPTRGMTGAGETFHVALDAQKPRAKRKVERSVMTAVSETPQSFDALEFVNLQDLLGHRFSSRHNMHGRGAEHTVLEVAGKDGTRRFALDDPAVIGERIDALIAELDRLEAALLHLLRAGPEGAEPVPDAAPVAASADPSTPAGLNERLGAAAAFCRRIMLDEIGRRIEADDRAFVLPAGTRALLLTRDNLLGSLSAAGPVPFLLSLRDAEGRVSRVLFSFAAEPGIKGGGITLRHLRPEGLGNLHRLLVTAEEGLTIERVEYRETADFSVALARAQVAALPEEGAPAEEMNPVRLCLELIRTFGRLAFDVKTADGGNLPAYCYAWSLFLARRYRAFKVTRRSGTFAESSFDDLSRPFGEYNAAVPTRDHRILSKHGVKLPLYARDAGSIVSQIKRLEEIFEKEFGYRVFLAYGTLLGCVREGGFIPHDNDLDMGWVIDVEDYDDMLRKRLAVIERLREVGLRVSDPRTKPKAKRDWFGTEQPAVKESIGIDIFPIWRLPSGEVFAQMERSKVRSTKGDWFKSFVRRDFFGQPVWIPENYEGFMEDRYGPTWRIPDAGYGV